MVTRIITLCFLFLLPGCAMRSASGPLCGGAAASVWAMDVLQKPTLALTCKDGEGLTFNSENQTAVLGQLLGLAVKLAPLLAQAQQPPVPQPQAFTRSYTVPILPAVEQHIDWPVPGATPLFENGVWRLR